jgi:hypothetical protein
VKLPFKRRVVLRVLLYVFVDIACVGARMGVPIFCIAFGFPVGWVLAKRAMAANKGMSRVLKRILFGAVLTSLFTLVVMVVIWGPTVPMLFDPEADIVNFGIPMILYEPIASFIGWEVLMMFISPSLQLLATVFGAFLALTVSLGRAERAGTRPADSMLST